SAQHSPTPLPSWPDLEDLEPGIRTVGGPPPHEGLEHRIEHALAQLSAVARIAARRTLPRPQFQAFPAVDAPGAAYTLDAENSLHYRCMDVLTGQPGTRQTVDADELVYWIVDDAARAVAWSFAYRSPAARGTGADTLKATVALPLWAAFVSALDPRWGSKTQATIDALLHNSKPTRRAS
ncbi:hypothetical protein PP556_25155, partial [Mycobacteroides abscessus]|nr:hypothetical protein [Mycobacteroides abscessus]MDV7195738.1 hypothetical protein [Mycolicibacterium fortuitum]MDM2453165.1 hypothetical protein [Mycobacteroides abscessus]MDM2458185.1 hypothetical protein [Mycobacteroides abscessus]MDM2463197.1 hypothetical protein [Mycobacteroides abscessus]